MNRIERLRALFDAHEIDAFFIPKVDEFMGEYIRPQDERLAWISGFTGSAGFAVITRDRAGLFVDGRYTLQARKEAPDFETLDTPSTDMLAWLGKTRLGVDANLLPLKTAQKWQKALGDNLKFIPNLIDPIWDDRPRPQTYELKPIATTLTGRTVQEKIETITEALAQAGVDGFLSNNPESLAWLLNLRGGEIEMLPAPMGYTLFSLDARKHGRVEIFGVEAPNFDCPAQFHPLEKLNETLTQFKGALGFDETSLPFGRWQNIPDPQAIPDPILHEKARKTPAELRASQDAHQADGQALIRFLAWLDAQDPTTLDEIKCAKRLLAFRQENPDFIAPSFATISAWNQNAANPHYHATPQSFATFEASGVFLIDSGAHYPGATTDITRTVAIGAGIDAAKAPYTEVLNGLANISQIQFPKGVSGRDIDPFARASLWQNHRNFAHGTGHGIGAQLSVHEGPASISPRSEVPLAKGMILSLEPGFYQEGEFGIRLENLAHIEEENGFLRFETLSFVPIDLRLIDAPSLWPQTQSWLNTYHQDTKNKHIKFLDDTTKSWLQNATQPI